MNTLQVLNSKQITIDSREVAKMMEVNHWEILRKLEGGKDRKGYVEILNDNQMVVADYFIKSSYVDEKGEERPCYELTRMGCEFLANKFTGEKGVVFTARYVKRFNEMEQQLQQPKDSYMIDDPIQRARAWIKEQEEKQKLLEENEKNKPKVLFAEAVENSGDVILVKEMATILTQHGFEIGQNQLFEYLRKYNYLCSRKGDMYHLPTKKYEHLFKVVKRNIQHTDGIRVKNTPKINGKGQIYFIKKFEIGRAHV